MKIGVLGTGRVGRTLAARLRDVGHDVVIGTRDVAATLARTEPDAMGGPSFGHWHRENTGVAVGTFAEAAAQGEVVVNATAGGASLRVLELAGPQSLAGKVLLDVANPLDFSHGMPPTLLVKDTDSLAEQIQRAFPEARVVKSLNTMNAVVMAHPGGLADGDHTVFVCGDDPTAKQVVSDLLRSLGWRDIIDLGALSAARGTEMVLPIWIRLMGALGRPMFNFKVVR